MVAATLEIVRPHTRTFVALAIVLVSVTVAATLWLRHDPAGPAAEAPLDPATARTRIFVAIDGLLDGGPVRLDAIGGEGAAPRERLTGEVDLRAGLGQWTETTPTESGTDVIAQTFVLNGVIYSRIYFSNETPPAFTEIADAAQASRAVESAVTVGGKLTDSLAGVRRMVAEVPFRSVDLGTADIADGRAAGIGVEFQTGAVYDWLSATGLEAVDGERPTRGTVTMMFWASNDRLVGFGARDDSFHDGELLHDVDFDVSYRSIERVEVTVPVG
jgi:hypothetical protein